MVFSVNFGGDAGDERTATRIGDPCIGAEMGLFFVPLLVVEDVAGEDSILAKFASNLRGLLSPMHFPSASPSHAAMDLDARVPVP